MGDRQPTEVLAGQVEDNLIHYGDEWWTVNFIDSQNGEEPMLVLDPADPPHSGDSTDSADVPDAIAALIECGGEATREELFEVMDVDIPREISDMMRRQRYNGPVTFRDGKFCLSADYTPESTPGSSNAD